MVHCCNTLSSFLVCIMYNSFENFTMTDTFQEQAWEDIITPIGLSAIYSSISTSQGFQGVVGCPVMYCPFTVKADSKNKRRLLHNHLQTCHYEDTIVIEKECRLPQCRLYGLFIEDANLTRDQESQDCKYHTTKRKTYLMAKEQVAALEINFNIRGEEIEKLTL